MIGQPIIDTAPIQTQFSHRDVGFVSGRDEGAAWLYSAPGEAESKGKAETGGAIVVLGHGLGLADAGPRLAARVLGPVPEGMAFTNAVAARVGLRIPIPGSRPLRRQGQVRYPIGHFDIYTGEPLERVVADQTAFLQRHLGRPGPPTPIP